MKEAQEEGRRGEGEKEDKREEEGRNKTGRDRSWRAGSVIKSNLRAVCNLTTVPGI